MTIDTAQLRELLAKATPGPWMAIGSAGYVQAGEGHPRHTILAVAYGHDGNHQFNAPGSRENGELIAAARNALPALLDEIDRLRAALKFAEVQVRADREGLLLCHAMSDGTIPEDDQLGRDGLAEYDEVLETITAALASGQRDNT